MTGIYNVYENGKQLKARGEHADMEWIDVVNILNGTHMKTGDEITIKCVLED